MDALLTTHCMGMHRYVFEQAGFTDTAVDTVMQQGWDAAKLHTERFGVWPGWSIEAILGAAFELQIASLRRVVHVPENKSAVDAPLE
ncbi:MAG TPA: hypothetical protein VGF27_02340 [Pseudoduganella sp.]